MEIKEEIRQLQSECERLQVEVRNEMQARSLTPETLSKTLAGLREKRKAALQAVRDEHELGIAPLAAISAKMAIAEGHQATLDRLTK